MSVPAPTHGVGQCIGWVASQTRRRRVRVYAHPPDGVGGMLGSGGFNRTQHTPHAKRVV